MTKQQSPGFTLIELSIVLVIMGLLAGGVLIGKDLIEAVRLRKISTNIEQYRTAAMTFKGKYGALPGDIPPQQAQQFGFSACSTGACFNGRSIGNGAIDDSSWSSQRGGSTGYSGETILFWKHLAQAGLIAGSVDPAAPIATDGKPSPRPTMTSETLKYLPEGPFKGSAFFVQNIMSLPYVSFRFEYVDGLDTGTSGMWYHRAILTPTQAWNIDNKFDDGLPYWGLIWNYDNSQTPPTISAMNERIPSQDTNNPNTQVCNLQDLTKPGNEVYNTKGAAAHNVLCGMIFHIKELY